MQLMKNIPLMHLLYRRCISFYNTNKKREIIQLYLFIIELIAIVKTASR